MVHQTNVGDVNCISQLTSIAINWFTHEMFHSVAECAGGNFQKVVKNDGFSIYVMLNTVLAQPRARASTLYCFTSVSDCIVLVSI